MRLDPSFLEEIRDRLPVSHVASRFVKLKKAGAEYVGLSPFNAERSPSFYVNDAKRSFFDFSANRNGSIFDLVMALDGLSFPDAVEQCARDAGVSMPEGWGKHSGPGPAPSEMLAKREAERLAHAARMAERREAEARSEAGVRRIAHRIWQEGGPIAGTAAEAYLLSRGIEFGWRFTSLRFHGRLEHRHPETGEVTYWPALIAAVRAPVEPFRFLAIWRIYLTPNGDKAPVPKPKLGLGSYTEHGGSVWLGRPTERANAAEGIETACGVFGLLRGREGVQAALSTSGLVNFIPPHPARSTLIWPDGDSDRIKVDVRTGAERHTESPGIRAAGVLRDRLKAEGHPTTVQFMSKRSCDYLDLFQRSKALLTDDESTAAERPTRA